MHEIGAKMLPQFKERNIQWETFVAVMRKDSDDPE